jgi:hypothetical protein
VTSPAPDDGSARLLRLAVRAFVLLAGGGVLYLMLRWHGQ